MGLPASSRFALADDLTICRVLNGMWQVAGAHGRIDAARAIEAMFAYHDAGFKTWDLADHYGPAEDFIRTFRQQFAIRYGAERLPEIQAFTKWVPNPGPMSRRVVEEAIATSLARMGVDRLDLLQFHWWDYDDPNYLDALQHLADLRDAGENPTPCADQFRHRTPRNHCRSWHPLRLEPGAVFADRSSARGADGSFLPRP